MGDIGRPWLLATPSAVIFIAMSSTTSPARNATRLSIRRSEERGHAQHGWLDSHHTFSFADYHDPRHMGFRALRVINEDRVAPGQGFGTHGHRDMEIISYVLEGALEHKDSLGTGSVIHPGDVQRMSAGTGVRHSEFNSSKTEGLHFLQIWILPDKAGYAPSYEEKNFSAADKQGRLRLVASPTGKDGSVTLHQDASLYAGLFAAGESTTYALPAARHAWIHVARGKVTLNGETLSAGDAAGVAAISAGEQPLEITGVDAAEVLLFDLG
jgi:redox-sensitive bicupin YhaK (pirin superfamily)